MKVEKRGDKYFIILSNGEVEISEQRLKLMDEARNDLLEYIEIVKKLTAGRGITNITDSEEMKLDFHVQIDNLCSTLKKCGDQLINDKGLSGYDTVDFIINADIKSLNVDINNIFQRHNIDVNKYWVAKLEQLREIFNTAKLATIAKQNQPIKTKIESLREQICQYGFFELEKIKKLSEPKKDSIIEKISESGLPYAIAMFDYLNFFEYLEKKHFDSKFKLNREISKWLGSDKDGRAVKGNRSSLLKNTDENKQRYTAHLHIENVKKDYELLK